MYKIRKDLPKISVVIPSYNKVAYIEATLQSIIVQKYPNLEVIIQDGGSGDGTVEIIKQYAKKYPRIFNWESKKDKGQVDAIGKGFRKATGQILTFINADDIYKDQALIEVGNYYLKNPKILWITGYGDIIDKNGKTRLSWITKYKNILLNMNNYSLLLIVNSITQPATFLAREAFDEFGPFTGTKSYVMEYDLWLKLGRIQMPGVIKKYLASFRLTSNNISSTYFQALLSLDLDITKKFTTSWVILKIHYLHNLARIVLISLMKNR